MQNIFWQGYSNEDRCHAIPKIQSIISKFGDIVDITIFSDISLSMKIDIEEFKIQVLYDELKTLMGMNAFECLTSNSKKERVVFLNTTFNKGTGNLTIITPAFPG